MDRLIWIDLEMTGLDPQNDSIIEIATVVTDSKLVVVAEGPSLAISHPAEVLDAMDEWNTRQHGQSGLSNRVLASGVSMAEAESLTLQFLQMHTQAGLSPMCGNSICQDRRFLARLMPGLERHFHYRNLDVTSLKILAGLWAPKAVTGITKSATHLALADIHDSIAELRHYREHFLRID